MRRDRENWPEKRARLGKRGGVITPALLPENAGLILVRHVLATFRLLSESKVQAIFGSAVAFFTQGVGAKDALADRNTIRQTYPAQTPNFTCAELDLNCYLKAKTVHANILSSKILHSTRGVRAAFITPHDTHHLQLPIPTCAPIVGKSNHFFFVPSLYTNTKLRGSNSASSRTNLFGKDNKNNHPQIYTFYLNPG